MAYDERLAARVRAVLADLAEGPVVERRMFGGLSFMTNGRLAVAVSSQGGLLVPVGTARFGDLLAEGAVEPMVMGRRTSDSWVHVLPAAITTEISLQRWVARGFSHVNT